MRGGLLSRFPDQLFILVIVGLLFAGRAGSSASAAVYYVNSMTGDDANSGTDSSHAWQTLAKVNATTFQAGDTILLRSGGAWTGQLHPLGSGTKNRPIVIDKYGGTARPIISGEGRVAHAVYLHNQSYWEINNLEITNQGSVAANGRHGVFLETTNSGSGADSVSHLYLRKLHVHDVNGLDHWLSGGIEVRARLGDALIEGCIVERTHKNGINVDAHGRDIVVRNNTIQDCACDAILMSSTKGYNIMEYNVAINCGWGPDAGNSAGIWTYYADDNICQFNECYGQKGGADGCAWDIDNGCHRNVVQYNYSHDNYGGMILHMGTDKNSIIRYNISQNDQDLIFDAYENPGPEVKVYNNSIYIEPGMSTKIIDNAFNAAFTNNIIYNLGSGGYVAGVGAWDHNCFFGNHPAEEPSDPHKITSDPMWRNPGGAAIGRLTCSAYQLGQNSPCVNAGIAVDVSDTRYNRQTGIVHDFFGNSLDGIPDRGAHEYTGNIGTRPNASEFLQRRIPAVEFGLSDLLGRQIAVWKKKLPAFTMKECASGVFVIVPTSGKEASVRSLTAK